MKRMELLLAAFQVPVDFVMLLVAAMAAYSLRFTQWALAIKPVFFSLTLAEFVHQSVWVMGGWLVIFAFAGLYTTDPNRKLSHDIVRVFLACSTGLSGVALVLLFSAEQFDSRFLLAAGWAFSVVFVSAGRAGMRGVRMFLYRAGIGRRRVAVIGNGGMGEIIIRALQEKPSLGYAVVETAPVFDAALADDLKTKQLDEMLFVNPRAHENETLAAIDFCYEHHIMFRYSADLFSTYATNMAVQPLAGIPVVSLKRTRLDGWGRVIKRAYDIIVSAGMILLFSPLLLVIALAILFETGRPILYKNKRVGKFGIPFYTLKFRSMHQKYCTGETPDETWQFERVLITQKNTKEDGPVYKIGDDPRVTRAGQFLRRWSLDELPQFFNVLFGSMSIVGPRPHQPREVAQYQKHHKHVLHIKPGMTGLPQISGRSDLSFEEEVRLDVLYMERWSVLLDCIICLKTPLVVFKKRRAL